MRCLLDLLLFVAYNGFCGNTRKSVVITHG
uniref:Uncharacterized protein n=1 Tax=Dulem virus 34 TaxID=3145752 RepID=A0AAU8B805_9CAUD